MNEKNRQAMRHYKPNGDIMDSVGDCEGGNDSAASVATQTASKLQEYIFFMVTFSSQNG